MAAETDTSSVENIVTESQHEKIVNALINDTKEKIKAQYSNLSASFHSETNPLGVKDAENIIKSLLGVAIVQRHLLGERLAESTSGGALFKNYLNMMDAINQRDATCRVEKKAVANAETKYKKRRALLNKVEKSALTEGEYRTDDTDDIQPSDYDD